MRQIRYNNASNVLLFEYPEEWTTVSALTLTITDDVGTELLAADSATLYTATTLDAAASAFADTVTLVSGAGVLEPGYPIEIAGVAGNERHRVKEYSSTTRIVSLEGMLEEAHAAADAVTGRYGLITVDTTTTSDFPKGIVLTLLWTPTGTGVAATTELAQVSVSQVDLVGLERRFSRLYPRAFEAYTKPINRMADMLKEAELQVAQELLVDNLDMQRIIDQDVVAPAIMGKLAYMWTFNGDEQIEDERAFLGTEYDKQINILKSLPIWIDHDQDLIEDDGEVTTHTHIFGRNW